MTLQFPPIYLLKHNFNKNVPRLLELENCVNIVHNINEAEVVLGDLNHKERARLELRKLGLQTEDFVRDLKPDNINKSHLKHSQPRKRRIVEHNSEEKEWISLDSDTESGSGSENERRSHKAPATASLKGAILPQSVRISSDESGQDNKTIKVVKLTWYYDSVEAGKLLPFDGYMVYEGTIVSKPKSLSSAPNKLPSPKKTASNTRTSSIISGQNKNTWKSSHANQTRTLAPRLHHETTSDHEDNASLPPLPDFLRTNYSCQRPTPLQTQNDDFISQLKIIEHARHLKDDDENTSAYSARSYSKAISAIAAYPYHLRTAQEIRRLPGVGEKVQILFEEWKSYGYISEIQRIEQDDRLKVLNTFWGIYNVGPSIARSWYDKGWRTLEDVQEAFDILPRDQQIGAKFYEDFEERIPRSEVEEIAAVVLTHANQLQPGFQMVICGGYRRGKPDCGDVDVILTHPDEDATHGILKPLLESLEYWTDDDDVLHEGYITHTLRFSMANSDRGQSPLPWKGSMPKKISGRKGFDTLDTMFVVWQNPDWPTKGEDRRRDPKARNPNLHRRVDIIVTPWKTAGCAIIGWSGGTVFEIDLRMWCRKEFGYKFDSSGVRRVADGAWVDLEAGASDLLAKEKQVFEGLGLIWREPTERCTD